MSDQNLQHRKRRRLLRLLAVSIVLLVIVVIAVPIIYFRFFFDPFEGVSGHEEFTRLSGVEAHARLAGPGPVEYWPSSIDPHDVEWMSYSYEYSMDSKSCWQQIKLSRQVAGKWVDWAHAIQRAIATRFGATKVDCEIVEGTILHRYFGGSPAWWHPPTTDWRATETMCWYKDSDSGVGGGTYSAFDPSASVLWIFDFSTHGERLWRRGAPPKGPTGP